MKTAIYTAYHKEAPRVASRSIIPIHVGRAAAGAPLPGMIGDDTGASISERNPNYCELTALYWAWKNAPPEVERLGLMHYRRLLDFTAEHPARAVEVTPAALDLDRWCASVEEWLDGPGGDVDLVLPRLHLMGRTVSGNYARRHDPADFRVAREIVARDHPGMLPVFDRVARDRQIRLGNIMVMRRSLFDRYCAWLFGILDEVVGRRPVRPQSPDQMRYVGYLAERLLTVFAAHLIETEPDLKLREVSILNLAQTLVTPYLSDDSLNGPEHVNVAFACDRDYLPHAAAMIRSLLDHGDRDRRFNLFLLHSGVAEPGRAMLREVVAEAHPDAVLHEIDTGTAFEHAHRSASRAPSNATYSRFLLFRLLPRLRRLLYLDCDMIVRADVARLFDADIGGAEIAGVTDWIMTRSLTGTTPTVDPDVPDLYAYHRDRLGLDDGDIARYLNAGVMLFDFAAMESVEKTGDRLSELARTGRYLFRDQDILNSHFRGRLATLDARWNVFNSAAISYGRVPQPGHDTALAAKRDPWIIHYADTAWKPWNATAVPFSQHYWQSLIRTPFYSEVVDRMMPAPGAALGRGAMGRIVVAGRSLSERVPALRGPLLRLHAALGHPGRR